MKFVFIKNIIYVFTYFLFYFKYPFLEEIWKKYEFDEAVKESDVTDISSLCNAYSTYIDCSANEQNHIYMKLLRNLRNLYNSDKSGDDFNNHGYNIFYWLYYGIKDDYITDTIINSIFQASCKLIEDKYSFSETKILVMLYTFIYNIDVIQQILTNNIDSIICSCKKFIKECVYSYRYMHKHYCPNNTITNTNMRTCLPVKNFKESYEKYISNENKYELPDLSSKTPINIIDCSPPEEIMSDPVIPVPSNQSERSIIQSASHALVAIAGITNLLVLIYKVNTIFIQNC
ncbi:hypothetical protein PCYB_003000 [Plasmodium cynomolgi strain B]|uniref:Uncharacterized protein n=1 Tax=Plasmodium cynomolgi (strain B) TaxID=1120755 RepID=K6UF63_PLACD|nr:hypothetical protein PCYB_003000 [Plasmodium cynomolgi strain B]GAB69551.1 hypothetical protein PCYB_003000 [Plasmodium cynomolgi strain B]